MGDTINFDYYYGIEAEQFSFYRVPRLLIKDERFKGLSSDATAKNADGKQARVQGKPGSRAGRNNVTVRGRYAVKMSGLHPMF